MSKNFDNNLLIATSNLGKLREVRSHFNSLGITLRDLTEFPNIIQPEETGATFEENAVLKAKYYSCETRLWTLADDSGLEVDALGGKPGVYSARYAGENATDSKRVSFLLNELKDIKEEKRKARFRCVLAFCSPDGILTKITTGVCEGKIASEPKGLHGFGYDPVFIPFGFDKTFGELPPEIKQKISHRAKALASFSTFFSDFLTI